MKRKTRLASAILCLCMGLMGWGGEDSSLIYASSVSQVASRESECKGTVIDDNGEPVAGASVLVKGTRNGTLTDIDGKFTLGNVKKGTTIEVSFIGYKLSDVVWNGEPLMVRLIEDSTILEDVVVIGYGTVRKADLAGSVSVMDNKSFKDQPVTRVQDVLNGRVSGVQVTSSGVPGGAMKIRVRGVNSVNKSNDPLYVVDGIVRESGLDGISPEDIQSMQVLKDASSTAIYGARGANGVVLVTTKTGAVGATLVTLDANFGVAKAYNIPEVMSTKDYAEALIKYQGVDKTTMQDYISGKNPGVRWMDEILRVGLTQDYKLSVSKGNKDTQYYLSGNVMNQKGVIIASEHTRYSFKANVRSKIYDWFEVTSDVNLSQTKMSGEGAVLSQDNPIWIGLNYSPTMDIMSGDKYAKDPYNNIQANPVGILTANLNDRLSNVAAGHVDLKFNIAKGLTFTSTNGVEYSDYRTYNFKTPRVYIGSESSMSNNNMYKMQLQSSNNLTYFHKWNNHSLTATGVWEATLHESRFMKLIGNNLIDENVTYWNVKNASTRDGDNQYSKWTMLSGVARVIYNYADKYILTGTFRADGSSRFTNKKWGYFPSIAAAWTVTNEDFMSGVKNVMNDLKVRASYGLIGNQDIAPYSTLGTMNITIFNMGTANKYTGYWSNGLETPDLTWEKVHQFDLGVDMGFFNNRLTLGLDYFHKKTTDALLLKTAANYLGGTRYWSNAGEVVNKGMDFSISARIIQNKDLQWTSVLNGSYIKNKVTKLTSQEPVIYGLSPASGTVDPATIVKEGEAIGTFYGYEWAGLEKDDNGKYIDMYYDKNGKKTAAPGGEDRKVLGKANPDFTFGWNNNIMYKNWDFNVFFNAAFGAKRLNLVRYTMNSMPGASRFVTDKNYFANIGKDMPSIDAANKSYGNSSKWVENADYLRLDNISVAYTFPKTKTKFADIRLSFSIQNVFTITGYKGIDPAGVSFSDQRVDSDNGYDMGTYPNPRTISFGIRVNL